MADLDDFFAKKDKKKAKSKPKFLTAEELVKNLEDTSKREAKQKKPEVYSSTTTVVPGGSGTVEVKSSAVEQPQTQDPPTTEEEWKEFEEEQRKDYTGLKIGQLTLNDDDEQSQTEGDDDDVDSEGNAVPDYKRDLEGPWKKVIPAEEVTQIPVEIEKPSKVYISPALRNNPGFGVSRTPKSRNRAAPDITNADYFPTLGAARPEEQRKKKNEPAFEEVKHGSRMQRIKEQPPAPVSVTNRFQSLEEDDS